MIGRYIALALALSLTYGVSVSAQARRSVRRRARPVMMLPGETILEEDFEKGLERWQQRAAGEVKWATGPKQARRGKGCLMAKLTQDKKANFVELEMEFDKASTYGFEMWARTDKEGKAVLFAQKGKKRRRLGNWPFLDKRWRPCRAQFSLPESGRWQFQLVVPSTFGSPACTMWIDDIRIVETKLPQTVNLTKGQGYNRDPSLVTDREGTIWVSWLSYRKGKDTVVVGRVDREGDTFRLGASWPVAAPKGSHILDPELASDRSGAWLVFAAEVRKNWDVYACRVTAEGPARPRRITSHSAVDCHPSAALLGGRLWVAWESNRDGNRQVYVSSADMPEPRRLSDAKANSYWPAIAGHERALWVAWHAYADGNYDLYGSRLSVDGEDPMTRRLTSHGQSDRHAQLLPCSHGLWIAWQREFVGPARPPASTRGYRPGTVSNRQSLLCRWGPDDLEAAAGWQDTILPKGTELPTLAVDGQNRIWVAARRARGQSSGWDTVVQCFAGRKWGSPQLMSSALGWDVAVGIVATSDRILAASQIGKTPAFKNVEDSLKAESGIQLASVALSNAPQPGAPGVVKLAEESKAAPVAKLRQQLGEQTPRRTIEYQGRTLRLFWGDFHEHTSISQCSRWRDVSPEDSYANERDIVNADFSAQTDHGYNFCPALWNRMAKVVRVNHDPKRFVTFLAEEWTSTFERYSEKHPEGFYGHRNLVFADPYFPRWFNAKDESTPQQIWDTLRGMKANFVQIPHQLADTGNVPTDWSFTDEVAQPVAEIFQARQSYEYKGCPRQAGRTIDGHFIQDAWAKGIVIGVIASPDHGGGQGKAAVYAPELTREAILDAVRARHCYGTSAARIFLDVRVNGRLMGEKVQVKRDAPIVVTASVIGANDVESVDLCRSNKFIYMKPGEGRKAEFEYRDMEPPPGPSYYYVRVKQKDGELAWSSPVWVTRE